MPQGTVPPASANEGRPRAVETVGRNAVRLLDDAQTLLSHKRHPGAIYSAISAIEQGVIYHELRWADPPKPLLIHGGFGAHQARALTYQQHVRDSDTSTEAAEVLHDINLDYPHDQHENPERSPIIGVGFRIKDAEVIVDANGFRAMLRYKLDELHRRLNEEQANRDLERPRPRACATQAARALCRC